MWVILVFLFVLFTIYVSAAALWYRIAPDDRCGPWGLLFDVLEFFLTSWWY